MHEEDVKRILAHPVTMPSSDGGIEGPSDRVPHPRNYGTFARVLGYYVRQENVIPFHTAIHKMSRLPADRIADHLGGEVRAEDVDDDQDVVGVARPFEQRPAELAQSFGSAGCVSDKSLLLALIHYWLPARQGSRPASRRPSSVSSAGIPGSGSC